MDKKMEKELWFIKMVQDLKYYYTYLKGDFKNGAKNGYGVITYPT